MRSGGRVAFAESAPGWYAGELTPHLFPEMTGAAGVRAAASEFLDRLGLEHSEFIVEHDYGSVREAVETYGFIFGRRAIDYLVESRSRVIRWRVWV